MWSIWSPCLDRKFPKSSIQHACLEFRGENYLISSVTFGTTLETFIWIILKPSHSSYCNYQSTKLHKSYWKEKENLCGGRCLPRGKSSTDTNIPTVSVYEGRVPRVPLWAFYLTLASRRVMVLTGHIHLSPGLSPATIRSLPSQWPGPGHSSFSRDIRVN